MADTAEAVPPLRFTTRDVPVQSRRRALYELREQGLLPLEPLPDSDTGFGDLSYFNRTFRRRYQITPSGVRRGDVRLR